MDQKVTRGRLVRAALWRAAGFAAVWWVVTEASAYQWPLAVAVVAAATATSVALLPPGAAGARLSVWGLARFVPFFLARSVLGGVDVSWRALRPGRNVRPRFVDYQVNVRGEAARVFFAAVVSLMPGTLSARLEGDRVRVHVLDKELAVIPALRAIDRRLSAVFRKPAA